MSPPKRALLAALPIVAWLILSKYDSALLEWFLDYHGMDITWDKLSWFLWHFMALGFAIIASATLYYAFGRASRTDTR